MNNMFFEQIVSLKNGLDREHRKLLKESEIERLSFNSVDPLNVLIHLDNLQLFWY